MSNDHPARPPAPQLRDGRFTLVLGGGGMRGLAHVGVLAALERARLRPARIVGTSIGSLVGAAWCAGHTAIEMRAMAIGIQRKDIFVMDHAGMALRRLRARAVYRREPLDRLLGRVLGPRTFRDLAVPLIVNTFELETGTQAAWGSPGREDVRVADAVFASCALPGTLPPRRIGARHYADGAVLENLPVRLAADLHDDPILAVHLGGPAPELVDVDRIGFLGIYARGFEVVMRTLTSRLLERWDGPPLGVVHPAVADIPAFSFRHTPLLLQRGLVAMTRWLGARGFLTEPAPPAPPAPPARAGASAA